MKEENEDEEEEKRGEEGRGEKLKERRGEGQGRAGGIMTVPYVCEAELHESFSNDDEEHRRRKTVQTNLK